jgi:hypothetical protein
MDRVDLYDVIRTPIVDLLYEENHKFSTSVMSKSMTDDEKEEMKDRAASLESDIEEIRIIQEELINHLVKRCPCLLEKL